jgi:excisionase family DNA binding protein
MSPRRPLADRELLTAGDVAFRLNVSERTVWRWVAAGKLPEPVRYSQRLIRWRACDIEAYVKALQPSPPPG